MPKEIDFILPDHVEQLTEAQYQRLIIELASYAGYTEWYHTTFSMRSKKGFPDLSLYNPTEGGCIYFEVKNETNAFSSEQRLWLHILRSSGFHAYGVRPRHVQLVVDVLLDRIPPPQIGTGIADERCHAICPPPKGGQTWA